MRARTKDPSSSTPLGAYIVGAAAWLLWRALSKKHTRNKKRADDEAGTEPWKEREAEVLVQGLKRKLSNVTSRSPSPVPPPALAAGGAPARRMFGAALAAATVAAAAVPNTLGGGRNGNRGNVVTPHRPTSSEKDRLARFDSRVNVHVRRQPGGVVVLDASVAVPEATPAQTWAVVRAVALGQVPAGGDGLRDVISQKSVPKQVEPKLRSLIKAKAALGAPADVFDEEATVARTARYRWGIIKGTSTVATRARVRDADATAVINNVDPERRAADASASSPSLERVDSEYVCVGNNVSFRSEFKVADVRVMGVSQMEVATRATASILRGAAVKNLGDISRIAAEAAAADDKASGAV
jgi:hypothetical protein